MSRQAWGGLGAIGIGVLIFISVLLIVFEVNPTAERNQTNIASQQRQLKLNQEKLYGFICAQAQTTANAFRFRQATPTGEVEGVRHFLTRMLAQQQTLRLSRDLGCKSNPGFQPFELQVHRALRQIEEILARFSPAMKEPISNALGNVPSGGLPPRIEGQIEALAPPNFPETGEMGISGNAPIQNPAKKPERPPFQIPREEHPPETPAVEPSVIEGATPPVVAEAVPVCSLVRRLVGLCP